MSNPTQEEYDMASSIIRKSDNPSPLYTAFIILAVLILLWVVNLVFLKKNLNGLWSVQPPPHIKNIKAEKYLLTHNVFTNGIYIDNSVDVKGYVRNNNVYLNNKMGVWDMVNNIIYWNDDYKWVKTEVVV